ncbi:AbrB/MazE/SpoVT family DNA-binding domain-containing protein [Solimicrobium silvestre]|uniref:Growth regulator n=1 Tax=Solimicrobium silvestre TaxID=2099400 RepID=A0A2S9GWG2_9BURK|nr:AbrB/MazE/SpoVT family DNA-binding domain-containing protein [Solimicrobium silvestre]PRC91996.1 Growth regulator [Solimicrobium silvestre]
MELSIQKWGNSAAVRLPTELLGMLKVTLGDKLSVDVRPDGIMLKAKRPAYALTDLVAQCDMTASEPADLAAWNNIKPVGREVW